MLPPAAKYLWCALSLSPFQTLRAVKPRVAEGASCRHSWVMLDGAHHFVPLPREKTLFTSPPRTALALEAGIPYPGNEPIAISCASGTAFLTNQRVSWTFQCLLHDVADRAIPLAHLPPGRSHLQIPVLLRSNPQPPRYSRLGPLLWS